MKVLAIGNSFSQDGTRYLYEVAKASGAEMTVGNLVIGGCPLRKHYVNILDDERAYGYEYNGHNTFLKVSIREALVSQEWDVVTVQQVSHQAPDYKTYQPYLNVLVEYIKKYAPQAKIYIQQTWGYENGSERLERFGWSSMAEMFASIENAYTQAAEAIHADGIIPSGKAMLTAAEKGLKVHRDSFHASLGFGRYLLALVWYKTLTGNSVLENNLAKFDEDVTEKEIAIAKEIAESIA